MHPAHEQDLTRRPDGPKVHLVESETTASSRNDFGPAGYHPEAVDAFVASVADRLDELQVAHLRALAEVDQLRTRLCEGTDALLERAEAPAPSFDKTDPHSVQRVSATMTTPARAREFAEHCAGAAHVIRTEIDTAQRRSTRLVHDAEVSAQNILDGAKRDAACALAAARAQSATKVQEAQASAERILQRAHQRSTEMSAAATMQQLDAGQRPPMPSRPQPQVRAVTAVVLPVAAQSPNATPAPSTAPLQEEQLVVLAANQAPSAPLLHSTADTSISLDEPMVKQERTFEALWNASSDETDANIERYFRPTSFNVAK